MRITLIFYAKNIRVWHILTANKLVATGSKRCIFTQVHNTAQLQNRQDRSAGIPAHVQTSAYTTQRIGSARSSS